ncbi:hypothetical protein B0O99DRAFT_15511 [Bisporella sp. PMI_857]|nr:hypothetical protein B0O99DRAFT_15511 [Bisporella sp. PMI_857]
MGSRSLYRNLCSDDDPPRSVAICPQRRCVAFGCSAGIELHWVDALTGQDLNRWFPLTSPSDYLFFLPPRKSVDSAKKLRLISSTASPQLKSVIAQRISGSFSSQDVVFRDYHHTRGFSRMDSSDHYRAIPLSDGYHILFTDPSTGLLCLGTDAPIGGPTKLLRKIWFEGPAGQGSPVAYASGTNITSGVRVAAAFGKENEQSIWFYSVPNDVFAASQTSASAVGSSWSKHILKSQGSNLDWMAWWPDDGLQGWLNKSGEPIAGALSRAIWPVKISGQKIGTCSGVVDLAVDSSPEMIVWAFSGDGIAKAWKFDSNRLPTKLIVMRDGSIREIDGEGDTEMVDTSTNSSPAIMGSAHSTMATYDGACEYISTL